MKYGDLLALVNLVNKETYKEITIDKQPGDSGHVFVNDGIHGDLRYGTYTQVEWYLLGVLDGLRQAEVERQYEDMDKAQHESYITDAKVA